jgi:hypothetical protein
LTNLIVEHGARCKGQSLVGDLLGQDVLEEIRQLRLGCVQRRQVEGAQGIEVIPQPLLVAELVLDAP